MKSLFKDVRSDCSAICRMVKGKKGLLTFMLVLGFLVMGQSSYAIAELPSTIDVTEYIALGVAAMALIVAAAIGGYTAFLLVRKSFRWIGNALG